MLPRTPHRRRTVGAAVLFAFAFAGAALTSVPSASAACAVRTSRGLSGTVTGVDNRDVNVSIGFDVVDANGRTINVSDGCPKSAGYSAPQQEKNHYVSGAGAPQGSRMVDKYGVYRGVTSRNWSLLNLPSNASSVWIEVYSRGYHGSDCTTCFGPKDISKYGYVMRRQVRVGSTGVKLRLPMSCGYVGGSNGRIIGYVKDSAGAKVTPDRALAWSIAPDSNTSPMGWGSASLGLGTYSLDALAAGQKYTVWLTYHGVTQKRTGVAVNACKVTPLNFRV